jgi:hypothetical protein
MKFGNLPVTSLEDATHDFEQLQTKDILNLTAESVLQLASTGTARKVNGGTSSFSFTASATSAVVTITHGLGTTPSLVILTCQNIGTLLSPFYGTFTSTNFPAVAMAASAITATVPFSWLAIG